MNWQGFRPESMANRTFVRCTEMELIQREMHEE